MFQERIQQANDMIRRQRLCNLHGVEATPEPDRVRHSESEGWYSGTGGMVSAAFGSDSSQHERWTDLHRKLGSYIDDAIQTSPRCSPFEGYIRHLHQSIALLTEFDATVAQTERSQAIVSHPEDPLVLQPNFFGIGLDIKRIIPWFKHLFRNRP